MCPEAQEFAIDPVQRGFEEVSLSRVLTIKETQQLERVAEARWRRGRWEGERGERGGEEGRSIGGESPGREECALNSKY